MRERKRLEDALATDRDLARRTEDISAYFELAREGESVDEDLKRELDSLRDTGGASGNRDAAFGRKRRHNAIVTIHPGAGGTESQDWAEMLMRMYLRWAERDGFETVLNDYQPGEEAGIKSATFSVAGEFAYGLLQQRDRRASPGAHFAIRSGQAAAHLFRQRLCLAGNRREHRNRDQAAKISRSTLIAPAARAASTSTPPTRPCASRTFPPASW